jgi:hypothetical protein
MGADDASSADMRRPPTEPDADPLALDDETVERLLRGELSPAQVPPGYAEVAALLAAATAPPSPGELSGQAAALVELRAATRRRRAAAGTRRLAGPPRRRRAGLAAVVLVGAVATGGVAAAATGHLPAPVREAARTVLAPLDDRTPPAPPGSSGAPPGRAATGGPASTGSQGSRPSGTTPRGPASTAAGPAAGQDQKGRCRAYLAGQGGEQGGKLDATAFQALARAAGGEDEVAGYCARLLPGEAKPKDDKPKDEHEPGGQGQGQGSPPQSPPGARVTRTAP